MINYLNPDFSNVPGRRKLFRPRRPVVSGAAGPVDVSIITPFHNTEELFGETVVSVLAQSLQNWEWIIVDDGSDDADAVARLADLTADDPRINVVHQDNRGPAAARNQAVRHSAGRYLCLLDSDDMLEPTYLEKCMWFLDSNPEFAFCNSFSVVFGDQEFLWSVGFEQNKEHIRANSGPPISMVRREAFVEVGGFDESIRFGHEDWDFWLSMAKAGHWGYTIREYLQWYRKRGGGRYEQIMRSGDLNDEFKKLIFRKYASLKATFPAPQRRCPEPYETVQTSWRAHNQLPANPKGRRVLFLVPWMVVGGADRVNLDLIEGLVGDGHEVTVCATLETDHRWEYKFSELTPDVFILPNILHLTDFPRFLAYLIQSRQIDTVVITGSTIGYQLLPYLRATAPQAAFVDLSHVEEPHWLNGGHPRFGVGYQDALDLNVVTTRHLAQWMGDRGADPGRIRVMHTGVRPPRSNRSDSEREAVRARFGIVGELPVVVFAGRICEQKRPGVLAEVLKEARNSGLRFQALVIGDGELRPMFEGLVVRYGLQDCVRTLGSLPHEQWLEILLGSDILLIPSQYEGISVALLEAMAAGVVPIVARVGGQEEIVSEAEGYLVPHGDGEISEYVHALERLITDCADRKAKSKRCQMLIASEYSWHKTIGDFQRILTEAHEMTQDRRCQFTLALGRELAALALENRRLTDAFAWRWGRDTAQQGQVVGAKAFLLLRLVPMMRQSRVGRYLLANPKVSIAGRRFRAWYERARSHSAKL
jgi:glycosyltransferase involved in cell wall biosynthesis